MPPVSKVMPPNSRPSVREATAKIDAVTKDAVLDYASRLAGSQEAALALYGPVAEAPGLSDLKERLAA